MVNLIDTDEKVVNIIKMMKKYLLYKRIPEE